MSWRGKNVLVTGADGFIGSHLVEALVAAQASVRAFVYYNSFSQWGWLEPPHVPDDVLGQVEFFPGDVRDATRVRQAVNDIDVVFHLASLIAIPYSYVAPDSYVQTNIQGGLNILNACRDSGVSRLVHTSTSEVYGTAQRVPIAEDHPVCPQSPYAASKAGADWLAQSYHLSFGVNVATVRPFNTYGPRQSARAVIPTILSQLHANAEQIHLGALTPTRDFTFVEDTVRGFLLAGSSDQVVGEVVNLGTGEEISIGDLAKLLMQVVGHEAEIVCDETRLRPSGSEVDRLCCDARKASELIGWEPAISLRDGLKRTSEWIAAQSAHYKNGTYNV